MIPACRCFERFSRFNPLGAVQLCGVNAVLKFTIHIGKLCRGGSVKTAGDLVVCSFVLAAILSGSLFFLACLALISVTGTLQLFFFVSHGSHFAFSYLYI